MKKLVAMISAFTLLLLGFSLPAQAEYQCEQDRGVASFCGSFSSVDISSDGKTIYAVEVPNPAEISDESPSNDQELTYRLVGINVSTGEVTVLIDWTYPKTPIFDVDIDGTRQERDLTTIALSPDGKKLLLTFEVIEEKLFGVDSIYRADTEIQRLKNEISVFDIATKKITDLSKSLKFTKSKKVGGKTVYEGVSSAHFSPDSKAVLFVKQEADGRTFKSQRVMLNRTNRASSASMVADTVSADAKLGVLQFGPGKDSELFNLANGRLVRSIKGSKTASGWINTRVLPKNSGTAFFELRVSEALGEDFYQRAQVHSIDSKGKRKLIHSEPQGAKGIRYAERAKLLLIHSSTQGLVLIKG